jgi:hypothetical protein
MPGPTKNLDLMTKQQRQYRYFMPQRLFTGKGIDACRLRGVFGVHVWPQSKPARSSGMRVARVSGTDTLRQEGRDPFNPDNCGCAPLIKATIPKIDGIAQGIAAIPRRVLEWGA